MNLRFRRQAARASCRNVSGLIQAEFADDADCAVARYCPTNRFHRFRHQDRFLRKPMKIVPSANLPHLFPGLVTT